MGVKNVRQFKPLDQDKVGRFVSEVMQKHLPQSIRTELFQTSGTKMYQSQGGASLRSPLRTSLCMYICAYVLHIHTGQNTLLP